MLLCVYYNIKCYNVCVCVLVLKELWWRCTEASDQVCEWRIGGGGEALAVSEKRRAREFTCVC